MDPPPRLSLFRSRTIDTKPIKSRNPFQAVRQQQQRKILRRGCRDAGDAPGLRGGGKAPKSPTAPGRRVPRIIMYLILVSKVQDTPHRINRKRGRVSSLNAGPYGGEETRGRRASKRQDRRTGRHCADPEARPFASIRNGDYFLYQFSNLARSFETPNERMPIPSSSSSHLSCILWEKQVHSRYIYTYKGADIGPSSKRIPKFLPEYNAIQSLSLAARFTAEVLNSTTPAPLSLSFLPPSFHTP